jgi:hypothetical protein
MSSIESSANSSGCSESDIHANMNNQWVMDDFGGALAVRVDQADPG